MSTRDKFDRLDEIFRKLDSMELTKGPAPGIGSSSEESLRYQVWIEGFYETYNGNLSCSLRGKAGDEFGELLAEAEGLCDELFISTEGGCNWSNIHEFESYGYHIYAGERDGFGWLTGCCRRNATNRVLTYG